MLRRNGHYLLQGNSSWNGDFQSGYWISEFYSSSPCAHSSAHPPPNPAHSSVDEKDPSSSLNKRCFVKSRCCHRRPEAFVGGVSCWSQGFSNVFFKSHADNKANLAHLLEDNWGNIFFYHSEDKHVSVHWFFLTFCFVGNWLKQLLCSETSNLAFSKCFFV